MKNIKNLFRIFVLCKWKFAINFFTKSCILPQCARTKIEVTALNGLELRS